MKAALAWESIECGSSVVVSNNIIKSHGCNAAFAELVASEQCPVYAVHPAHQ